MKVFNWFDCDGPGDRLLPLIVSSDCYNREALGGQIARLAVSFFGCIRCEASGDKTLSFFGNEKLKVQVIDCSPDNVIFYYQIYLFNHEAQSNNVLS